MRRDRQDTSRDRSRLSQFGDRWWYSINPSLDDYVTTEALKGLFGMVEKKELDIRTNKSERVTDLLTKVFAKQDK